MGPRRTGSRLHSAGDLQVAVGVQRLIRALNALILFDVLDQDRRRRLDLAHVLKSKADERGERLLEFDVLAVGTLPR